MKKHMWIMALCCIIPAAGLLVVRYLGIPIPGWTYGLFILLCPLSHMLLMGAMGHDHHQETAGETTGAPNPKFDLNLGHDHNNETDHEGHHPETIEKHVPEEAQVK